MTPSTGPKNSSRWKRDPGLTPVRIPGRQRRPSYSAAASRARGATSHFSPSSRVVRAQSSFPRGVSITGPTSASGSVGGATRSDVVASTSCRRKRCERATGPTRITSDAAEHFCPAWPKALLTTSDAARSRSADGMTIIAFLPLVSARSGRSGRHERKRAAVSHEPVRMTRSTPSCAMRRCPSSPSSTSTRASTSRGTPASHRASATTAAQRRACGAGLNTTPDPAASAASTPPAGIATGKFHGGVTTVSRAGTKTAPLTRSSSRAVAA